MESRTGPIPLAVSPSAAVRPIASRTKMLLEAPILPTLLRLVASAAGALLALSWLDAGTSGFFIAVAAGFAAYGALTTAALLHVCKSGTK